MKLIKYFLFFIFLFLIINNSYAGSYTENFNDFSNINKYNNLNISSGLAKPIGILNKEIPLNSNPIVLLRFNNNYKDEISQTNLLCNNCPPLVNSGLYGGAIKLGINSNLKIPSSLLYSINTTGKLTIVLTLFNKNLKNCILSNDATWSLLTLKFKLCEFDIQDTVNAFYLNNFKNNFATFTTGNFKVKKNEWRNIFLTYNKNTGNYIYYYNGKKIPIQSSFSGWRNDVPYLNASLDFTDGLTLNGGGENQSNYILLDEIAIYDRILTENEIRSYSKKISNTFNFTSKQISSLSQMYGLNVSWVGESDLIKLEILTDNTNTWCELKNNESLSSFSVCKLNSSFKYRLNYYGNLNSKGIDNLKFTWLGTNLKAPSILNLTYNFNQRTSLNIKFKTDELSNSKINYSFNNGVTWNLIEKNTNSNFDFNINNIPYTTNIDFKIMTSDIYGKKNISKIYSIVSGNKPSFSILTITDNLIENQSKDLRIGAQIATTSSHWSRTVNQNFLENPGFEIYTNDDFGNDLAQNWMGWNSHNSNAIFTAKKDSNEKVSGKYSQKIIITDTKNSQFNLNEYIAINLDKHKKFVFSCMIKSSGSGNITFRTYKNHNDCNFDKTFSNLNSNWDKVGFNFTTSNSCGIDKGKYFTTQIDLKNFLGTIWIDNCEFKELTDVNNYGLSNSLIENTLDLRFSTLRLGGLEMNMQSFSSLIGNSFERSPSSVCDKLNGGNKKYKFGSSNLLGINELFQYSYMSNSNPELVIPWTFDKTNANNLLEYLFGDENTFWGKKRILNGYSSWDNKFNKIVFEMGNELTFWLGSIACYPDNLGSYGSVPNDIYANWAEGIMFEMKNSKYWNSSNMKIGFNIQNRNTWGQSQIYDAGKLKLNGGNADFATIGNYVGKVIGSNIYNGITLKNKDYLNDPNKYFKALFGWSYSTKEYINYLKEVSNFFYSKELKIGVYEYSAGQDESKKKDLLYAFRVSVGAAVAMLDNTLMGFREGFDTQNYFAFQSQITSSHAALGDYPYYDKRPTYYALKLYGNFQRGKMIESNIDNVDFFNPFGNNINKILYVGGTQGINSRYFPKKVPYLESYVFKENNRYVYFIINRNVYNSLDLKFNLKNYNPSNNAQIHILTSKNISDGNEAKFEASVLSRLGGFNGTSFSKIPEKVNIKHSSINNFKDGKIISIPPFSIFVLVNYKQGKPICLDEDGDGYASNNFEKDSCKYKQIDCNDNNQYINPGANKFCDCNFADNSNFGSPEISNDNLDNNCNGLIDEGLNENILLNLKGNVTHSKDIITVNNNNNNNNPNNFKISNKINLNCISDLKYGNWSLCILKTKTRKVYDLNFCIKSYVENKSCSSVNFSLDNRNLNLQKFLDKKYLTSIIFTNITEGFFYSNLKIDDKNFSVYDTISGTEYFGEFVKFENNKYYYSLKKINLKTSNNLNSKNESQFNNSKNLYIILFIFLTLIILLILIFYFKNKKLMKKPKFKTKINNLNSSSVLNDKKLLELKNYIENNKHFGKAKLFQNLSEVGWDSKIIHKFLFEIFKK